MDLTQHEVHALRTRYNLADAHTHQRQSQRQQQIVSSLGDLWYEAENTLQAHREQQFVEAFFELHGQPTALRHHPMLSYAASVSTVAVALFLARRDATVTLVEPCFDNLADVLRYTGTRLRPLDEAALADPSAIYDNLMRAVRTDALFLVDPNNPTGFSLLQYGREGFAEVARFCRDTDTLLIVDFCFASFAVSDPTVDRFDVYELLDEMGVSYIAIEDTGKTWPVQDAKCAILLCSDDVYECLYNVHTSLLLNVSPFVLNLLTSYVRDSIRDSLASVREVLNVNRDAARMASEGTLLVHREPAIDVSVAWFEIADPTVSASELQHELLAEEIYVLPGTYFYWHHRLPGERFVRLALARDSGMFQDAMVHFREVLCRYG